MIVYTKLLYIGVKCQTLRAITYKPPRWYIKVCVLHIVRGEKERGERGSGAVFSLFNINSHFILFYILNRLSAKHTGCLESLN